MRTEMRPHAASRSRDGVVRPELQQVVEGLDFVPKRLPRSGTFPARTLLRRDGAVILTGWPVEEDSAVNAAAALLGTRLRELEQVREKTTNHAKALELHRDGVSVVVDIQGRRVHLRVTSRVPSPDVHPPPRVCRLIEWTRGGRMIVRTPDYAQPAPRETRWEEHERQINDYADLLATLTAQVQHETTLAAGEVLILDNYRCLHGVRAHEGTRTTHVLRCKSDEAW